jgi:hypothetical protein
MDKLQDEWVHKSGTGLWAEYENVKTGESTMKTYKMAKVSNWDECDHYYDIFLDGVSIQCRKCGKGGRIVWGINFIKDGKIVSKL